MKKRRIDNSIGVIDSITNVNVSSLKGGKGGATSQPPVQPVKPVVEVTFVLKF